MAKEKLLFVLVLILLFGSNTRVVAEESIKKEDLEWANNLSNEASKVSMNAIKETWLNLQQMERGTAEEVANNTSFEPQQYKSQAGLKVFVSSTMGTPLLKNYLEQAKKYNATLVFRGLPDGSWRKLSELIYEITGGSDHAASIQLDDMAFTEYGITSVPAIVLSKEPNVFEVSEGKQQVFDKVIGNVGLKRALEQIAEAGELRDIATSILNESRGRDEK